jgi:RNA polymerase subunit RPABC4/transcription elongation factor Spt4
MQVRCKTCGGLLEKEAKACSGCGTKTTENQSSGAINNIEFEQKGDSKRFKANFTDFVGENLVYSLSGLFLGTPNLKTQNPFANNSKVPPATATNQSAKKELNFEYAQEVTEDVEDINSALVKIFSSDNDELKLINQRLKYSGKRDHAIRITLVALYAYSIINRPQISKSIINKMLQDAAVLDTNYTTWLGRCDEIKKIDGDLLELNLPGKDAAIEILKEFLNPSVTKGSVHFSALGTGKKGKGKGKKMEGDFAEGSSAKSSSKSSNMSPAKMIDILISEKYFSEKRRIPNIIKYCKDNKGQSLDSSTLSVALLRKVKSQTIKREENPSDKQYEYFQ